MVKGAGPCLLERDWLKRIQIDWKSLALNYAKANPTTSLNEILDKQEAVFKTELCQAKNIVASLHIATEAKPVFCKARPMPYALREKVENELNRLQKENIIEPVQFSNGQPLLYQ